MTSTTLPAFAVNSFVSFPGLFHHMAFGGDRIGDVLEAANKEFFLLTFDPLSDEDKYLPYAAKMQVEEIVRLPDGAWSIRAICKAGAKIMSSKEEGEQCFVTADVLAETGALAAPVADADKEHFIQLVESAYPLSEDGKPKDLDAEDGFRSRLRSAKQTDEFLALIGLVVGPPYRNDGIPGFAFRPMELPAADRQAWYEKMSRRMAILGEPDGQKRLVMFRDLLTAES